MIEECMDTFALVLPFADFMLKSKSLFDHTNLFSPTEIEQDKDLWNNTEKFLISQNFCYE